MKRLACLVLLGACASSEPDPLDEILQDLAPEPVDYAAECKESCPTIDELVALHCPGVVYADGVTTYRGLTGTYRRMGITPAGEISKLVLFATRDNPDAQGTFTGTRAPATPLAGKFAAIGDNPAIGAAISFDFGADGQWDQVHFVLGTRRSFGRVAALCLAGADKPFLMTRSLF